MASFLETTTLPLASLTPFPGNARRGNVEGVRTSLRAHGQYRSLVVRRLPDGSHQILCGNHTAAALLAEGEVDARCEVVECSDVDAVKINIGDNRWSDLSSNDDEDLLSLLEGLEGDYTGTGYDEDDLIALQNAETPPQDWRDPDDPDVQPDAEPAERPSLADRFLQPPFDVIDARSGWWRARKRQWLDQGIASTAGRDATWSEDVAHMDPDFYDKKDAASKKAGRELTAAEFKADYYDWTGAEIHSGTSVFDPVLCELVYRWYSRPGATILDPFAGGSVRGVVASALDRQYYGNDLSPQQVAANVAQLEDLHGRGILGATPTWTVGDSTTWAPGVADLLFTCPPYYDLEKYSDDPADISGMDDAGFAAAYTAIIGNTAGYLRNDRFAVIVTGDARSPGGLRDLRGLTVAAAAQAGLQFVSGAVLLTPVGGAKIAAARNLLAGGILARTHQDVLVFCKGSRRGAAAWRGQVSMDDPAGWKEA